MPTVRIDTHHHIVPPVWAQALQTSDYFGGQPTPAWSPDAAVHLMDELSIRTAIVSVGRPGVSFVGPERAPALARQVNDYAAELCRSQPCRFGFFACLPLPDIPAAVSELEYALGTLNADGVILLTNYDGRYLGDPAFEPVMDALERHNAPVFIHPTAPPGPGIAGVPPFSADFLLDTTRAALNLVRNGVVASRPGLRMILSHAGGFVPYAAHRIASLTDGANGHVSSRAEFIQDLRSFWYDTALSANSFTLPSLLEFADPSRILFGSDWPYARGDNAQYFTAQLDAYPLTDQQRQSIMHRNASRLIPRLEAAS